jgi:hypothetical protein
MNKIIILLIFSPFLHLFGQTPTLIFHSGFEPNTDTTIQTSNNTDLIGVDNSVSPPNDWVNDLESSPNIGSFNLQYQGGNDTMRHAQIAVDPTNSLNNALWFWIKHPNVSGTKGRVQGNLYNSPTGFTSLLYSIRLYLPHDLDPIKYVNSEVKWFTLMEFWNNPNWLGDPFPFRVSVNLQKIGIAPDSLRFGVHGQIETSPNIWSNVWDTTNMNFAVPTGKWMSIKINYVEGDSNTGKFHMTVTPDGENTFVLYNLTEFTHHPSDPNPDGLTHFNPFKLYTSKNTIDEMRNSGKLVNVFWDDFELWNNSTVITEVKEKTLNNSVNIYPNPFSTQTIFQTDKILKGATLKVYNSYGQMVKEIKKINGQTATLFRDNLPNGLYFIHLTEDNKVIAIKKILITK